LLLVLDGIRPDVLRAAIRDGDAPALGLLAEKGEALWDAVSVFPSITPAATAAIVTGEPPSGAAFWGMPGTTAGRSASSLRGDD
jgi:predicted AlkP superfamily pyrophosphatase or phosphodiesterase